jgi:hypothetical protein
VLLTKMALSHRCCVISGQPNRSVALPRAVLALSRLTSFQRSPAGWAVVPSTSTHTPYSLYKLSM